MFKPSDPVANPNPTTLDDDIFKTNIQSGTRRHFESRQHVGEDDVT